MLKDISTILQKYGLLFLLYAIMLYTSTYKINVYIIVAFTMVAFIVLPIKKYIDKTAIAILCFSISYVFISYANGYINSYYQLLCHLMSPIVFYCFGKDVMIKLNKDFSKFIIITLLLFTLGTFISTYNDIILNGFMSKTRLITSEGRSGNIPATLLGVILSLNLVGIAVFINNKENKYKSYVSYIFLLLCILSLICNLHLVNRTGIVVCIITTIVTTIYANKRNKFNIILSLTTVFLIVLLLFESNIISSSIIEAYEERNKLDKLYNRGYTSERDVRWLFSLEHLFTHPLGWYSIKHNLNDFAHNLWLDVARIAGIIPFTALLVATLYSIKDIFYIYKSKLSTYNIIFISLYVCIFISSFLEPIVQGLPIYLYIFTMIWGMIRQHIIINKYYINNQ